MATPAFPQPPISGYTGINTVGCHNLQTEILPAQSLASGDVILTNAQAITIGIIEVTTGHATNAIVIPASAVVVGNCYYVVNSDGALAANIKIAGGSAISIAANKAAAVYITSAGTLRRLTPDA
jgi:subtilisin family serine protease